MKNFRITVEFDGKHYCVSGQAKSIESLWETLGISENQYVECGCFG